VTVKFGFNHPRDTDEAKYLILGGLA
jgi:hypothetical protein